MSEKPASPPTPIDATLASRPTSRARAREGDRPSGAMAAPDDAAPEPRAHTPPTPVDESEAALNRVLLDDELTRAHGFSGVIGLIAAGVLLALPALDGDREAKRAFAVAVAVVAAFSVWVWRATGAQREYVRWILRTYAWMITITVLFVEQYVGVFSPVAVLLILGISYLGQSADRMQSHVIPGFLIVGYVAQAVLLTFGLIPDRGLFAATHASFSSHLFGVFAGTGVLLLTTYLARRARASMRASIARSNEATLLAQRRQALLVEAQQHLERALDVALGQPGHHTGKHAGRYLLDVIIGRGAMGEIYAAKHVESGQRVAVKLLQPSVQQRTDLVERFLREGEICQRLDSPHLVQVHAVGRLDSGAPYLAMELLEGSDLAALLRKQDSLPLNAVVGLARALAEGLSHAHGAGVVHRDLKPVNVFRAQDLAGRPLWKILDFGISKLSGGSGTLTHVGIVGTPGYMSPEQARGQSVDHRSDIFSMALVLYRALTGRPAFTGDDTPQIMFEVVYKTPERPSAIIRRMPSEIDLVLAIALAKDPEERWQSARDFADAFELASRQNLGAELKARAHAIVKAYPWGQAVPQVAEALER